VVEEVESVGWKKFSDVESRIILSCDLRIPVK